MSARGRRHTWASVPRRDVVLVGEEAAVVDIEDEEDYCDYVFLLERRASGGGFVPYLWRFY